MEDLLIHIGQLNTFKKLAGDYIFHSTDPEFWTGQRVASIESFEHWTLKREFDSAFRALGHRGFYPFNLDQLTTAELQAELTKLQETEAWKTIIKKY